MLNTKHEYKGFHTTKPVESLLPVEALALLNRWAKLHYFYHDDLDLLYEIKEEKIAEWLKDGEIAATSIIIRESPAIAGMKIELANRGNNLDWLDYDSYSSYLSEAETKYFKLLTELAAQWEESGFAVDYPQDIYENWRSQVQPQIKAYEIAKQEYDKEFQRRQPILKKYEQSLKSYSKQKEIAAKNWAKINNARIARSNSGKSLKKDWLKRLEKQGFSYEPKPPYPFSNKLEKPEYPQMPPKSYIVNFENYLPGSLSEIEEVLSWLESLVDIPEHPCDIDEDFICIELEDSLREIVLDRVKKDVLKIFKDIVEGQLSDPKDIYNRLIEFDIDYQAIGMASYTDFRNHLTVHRDFGKWHEINFSPTGYWLIEFQSTIEPTITLHVPYNRNCQSQIKINLEELPKIRSEQANFGREINAEEKKNYPIEGLLKILGLSRKDFPYELEKYQKPYAYDDWDDDWF